jgi:penicillin-binding protein 1B
MQLETADAPAFVRPQDSRAVHVDRLETKATKDEILELYLNDVYLGNRGSFALHGVAEASKIYFARTSGT